MGPIAPRGPANALRQEEAASCSFWFLNVSRFSQQVGQIFRLVADADEQAAGWSSLSANRHELRSHVSISVFRKPEIDRDAARVGSSTVAIEVFPNRTLWP
jgi:hypothetical protein